ncbi:unnamed protein product [Symbiodinium natans]|uniref:Uncharacterized protein n=1 Tax=Symbiodinium natans TaxID=878477 RepID=A0A812JJ32_9DINO|nr:unnamed protein product [Symbiodinium natans]
MTRGSCSSERRRPCSCNHSRVLVLHMATGEPVKADEKITLETGSLQVIKMDLSLEGVWNVDISQGYSFVLTVTGSEASFEGGSYGTWSDIGVDRDQATFRATWHSGRYGSRGTLRGSFDSPHEGTYEAFFTDGTKVHGAVIRRSP